MELRGKGADLQLSPTGRRRSCATASRTRVLPPSPSERRPRAPGEAAPGRAPQAVGVIGAGAMGGGVVASLCRAGLATHVRDIRREASGGRGAGAARRPVGRSARPRRRRDHRSWSWMPAGGHRAVRPRGRRRRDAPRLVVLLASDPRSGRCRRLRAALAAHGALCIDAPVSGGPRRAADGTMTMMVAGRCRPRPPRTRAGGHRGQAVSRRHRARRRRQVQDRQQPARRGKPGRRRGSACARHGAGLDPALVVDVVNASSGGSWIFADRMPRALDGDYAPRAAARILAKDVGIAAAFARGIGWRAVRARRAGRRSPRPSRPVGEMDDAVVYRCARAAGLAE